MMFLKFLPKDIMAKKYDLSRYERSCSVVFWRLFYIPAWNVQWGRNEFFLREDLFYKKFWNDKFLAKYISTKPEIYGRTGTPILPGSALTGNVHGIFTSFEIKRKLKMYYMPDDAQCASQSTCTTQLTHVNFSWNRDVFMSCQY